MLIDQTIHNLINGVSQQPSLLRLPSQCEEMLNALPTAAGGLKKRPGTLQIAQLEGDNELSPFLNGSAFAAHIIDRAPDEKYIVVIRPNDRLRVYNLLTGAACVVQDSALLNNGAAGKYTRDEVPFLNFRFQTIADSTFVVNRTKTVTPSDLTSSPPRNEAMIRVKGGSFGKAYTVRINGVDVASFTTPDGSSFAHNAQVATELIASNLFSSLAANLGTTSTAITLSNVVNLTELVDYGSSAGEGISSPTTLFKGITFTLPVGSDATNTFIRINGEPKGFYDDGLGKYRIDWPATPTAPTIAASRITAGTANYSLYRTGSLIYISSPRPFKIEVFDGVGGTNIEAFKDRVQAFSRLPAYGFDGFRIEVAPEGAEGYWVRYSGDSANGFWEETTAPSTSRGLELDTMPLVLANTGLNTFSISNFLPLTASDLSRPWRVVGTETTNPDPSFVGKQIQDVFVFRNRLGFISEDSVSMSEDGQFFNFYRTSVSTLLDSDPINVNVVGKDYSPLRAAVAALDTLILMSSREQYAVEDTPILSAKTISIRTTTSYSMDPNYRPVSMGSSVFFAAPRGAYNSIREMYIAGDQDRKEADDITAHVPSYINRLNGSSIPVGFLAGMPTENMLFVSAHGTQDGINSFRSLWVYRQYIAGNEKLQSAWSRWEFSGRVVFAGSVDSTLYLLMWYDGSPEGPARGLYLERMELDPNAIDEGAPYSIHLDRRRRLTVAQYDSGTNITRFNKFITASGVFNPDYPSLQAVVSTIGSGEQVAGQVLTPFYASALGLDLFPHIDGDWRNKEVWFGVPFEFRFRFSTLYLRKASEGGPKADPTGRLQIRRMSINLGPTGYLKASVESTGRDPWEAVYTGKILGTNSAVINAESVVEGQDEARFTFPILSRNTQCSILLTSNSPSPVALLSADWQGFFTKQTRST